MKSILIVIFIIIISLLGTNILIFNKNNLNNFLENIGRKSEKIIEIIIDKN